MDGYATGESGSQAGDSFEPYVDLTSVYEGIQALPILYNNSGFFPQTVGAKHSEVYRIYEGGADFTRHGNAALGFWFYGSDNNIVFAADVLYVAVQDTTGAVAVTSYERADPAATDPLADPTWQEMRMSFADLSSVDLTAVERLYIGVGNRINPSAGGSGRIVVDEIRLYPE